MKYFFIILFLLGFSGKIFPQFYEEKTISPVVKEYMNLADSVAANSNSPKILTDKELDHAVKLLFKTYNEDPIGLKKEISRRFIEWGKKVKEGKGVFHEPKPGGKEALLKSQINKKYGGKFTEVISTPAFIKGKVISINSEIIQTDVQQPNDNLGSIKQVNLTVYVEEVLKGGKFFKKDTTIGVSYNADWLSTQYKTDSSYLFPLRPWTNLREYSGRATLQELYYKGEGFLIYDSSMKEIYPIENGFVYSEEDFFETGKRTKWKDFKEHFKKAYMIWDK